MSAFRVLLEVLKWLIRLFPAYSAFAFSCWVLMAEVIANTPFHRAMVWALLALGAAVWAYWAVLCLVEKYQDWSREGLEGKRVAKLLQDSVAAGHRTLEVAQITNIWTDPLPAGAMSSTLEWNIRLRRLKDAVSQDLLKANLGHDSFPSKKTPVYLESAVEFFRKRLWRKVKPRQSGEVYYDERFRE